MTKFHASWLSLRAILYLLFIGAAPNIANADYVPDGLVYMGPTEIWPGTLVIDPLHPQTIYSGSWHDGVFKSTDGGTQWIAMNTGLPAYPSSYDPTPGHIARYVALNPLSPTIVYAGTNEGVYKTTNGGDSWIPTGKWSGEQNVDALAVAPSSPDIIYAAAQKLYKSTDGGGHWTEIRFNFPMVPRDIFVDPSNPDRVFASGYVSTDGGNNWQSFDYGRPILFDPTSPQTLYAGSYKSTDGGITWTKLPLGLGTVRAISPSAAQTLYGADKTKIYKSTDGGATWQSIVWWSPGIDSDNIAIAFMTFDTSSPETAYAICQKGIFKTTDGGSRWKIIMPGFPTYAELGINSLAVSPSKQETLYVATSESGVLKTKNGGKSWICLNSPDMGLMGLTASSVALDPSSPETIYAGTATGIYKSTDGGDHWSTSFAYYPIFSLAINPSSPQIVFAGMSDGILRTTDGGSSWYQWYPAWGTVNVIAIDPLHPQTIYAGQEASIVKSTNGGTTWKTVYSRDGYSSQPVKMLAINPISPQTIYAGGGGVEGGFIVSTDGGSSWGMTNLGSIRAYSMAFDSLGRRIYLVAGERLYKSVDAGSSWTQVNEAQSANILALHPFFRQTLYLGCAGSVCKLPPRVPWDVDGEGITDVAVWRPDTGIWYTLPSDTQGSYAATPWGLTQATFPYQVITMVMAKAT